METHHNLYKGLGLVYMSVSPEMFDAMGLFSSLI